MGLPQSPAIEAEFARLNRLRFAPALETRFDAEGQLHRKRVGRISLLVGIVIYDGFLFADWQILSDMVGWLALMRLGVFTPLCLLILLVLPRTTSTAQIDAMAVAGSIVAVLLPMAASIVSQSPYVLIYQFGSMITLTYFTLVQRVLFRFAIVGLAAALAIQLWCVAQRPEIDTLSYEFVVNFYVAGVVLLLTGSFILERSERLGFLERMRGEFLVEHIRRTARTDLLTGLSNRHHLASVEPEIAEAEPGMPVSALMIDIDHFKRFNDTQGHIAGDRCIQQVAGLVREALAGAADAAPGGTHAFRFGGEEFLVLLPGKDLLQAAVLGEAIRRRLGAARIAHPAMGEDAVVTVSVGVAACRVADFSLDALVGAADAALYRAKRDGRDRLTLAA